MTALRPPDEVMRLARLGVSHQTRLSFMRVLLRKMRQEAWRFERAAWQIDENGVGHAVYCVTGPRRSYSLVAFAHDLPDDQRSDRVIAERWDATFTLFDGIPNAQDIARLAENVPLQEAGRISDRELVLSRANRSVRLWDHVVDALSQHRQPDAKLIAEVGYLMRTTAVYGSGKFGAADHAALNGREIMAGPFRAEMLAVWLIRAFSLDLVEHAARMRGGEGAAVLDQDLRRQFGIGNSTGLGMAPFLVNHPALLNAWITARETGLARVRAIPAATPQSKAQFVDHLERAAALFQDHLDADLDKISACVARGILDVQAPWEMLSDWASDALSLEGQELLVSLMLEPHGALVDDLAETMSVDEMDLFAVDGSRKIAELRGLLEQTYGWALQQDYALAAHSGRFWYVSEAKLEPRLGERYDEDGAELEQPLDIARRAAALAHDLAETPGDTTIAAFLEAAPQHRRIIRRLQISQTAPYSEIRDNLISADMRPIDMLRCKLAFFGATRFDPRSDRWLRITMFQNAPLPDELMTMPQDDWVYPQARNVASETII